MGDLPGMVELNSEAKKQTVACEEAMVGASHSRVRVNCYLLRIWTWRGRGEEGRREEKRKRGKEEKRD